MASPYKIPKQPFDNSTQDTNCTVQACSRQACCEKTKILEAKSQTTESNKSSVKPTIKLTTSKPNQIGSKKLISNLKPNSKPTPSALLPTSVGQATHSENKQNNPNKSLITVLKPKKNKTLDSVKCKPGESKSTLNTCSIEVTKSNSDKMVETTKKVKRKKLSPSALANKKRITLIQTVNQAIKSQKIFMINSVNPKAFPSIRSALKARGWLEKSAFESITPGVHSRTSETIMKLLRDTPAYFHWSVTYVDFAQIKNFAIVNRFPKNIHFTTKVGLCTFLEDFQWFYTPDTADTIVPRTFNIVSERDMVYFSQYYVLNACISLLKFIVDTVNKGESKDLFTDGEVPVQTIDFAILHCDTYIRFREHRDIDNMNESPSYINDSSEFLKWFYEVTQRNASFITMNFPVIHATYLMCKMTLEQITPFWDLINLEGIKNLWIIKPSNMNCGRGVHVKQTLDDILLHVKQKTDSQFGRYVIQKYIERPMLIFNTKFDIRQWFLVTSTFPLVIWIYSECYLRFSSQQFSLENLHESVHLTNNSVQCNYTNGERDYELPEENMWHSDSFKRYLDERGFLDKWNDVIFPGMCKGITGAVLASQNEMLERSKSFELYGADFLIGEDFTTILIEINSGPCMRYTTSVTEALCKSCLEDIIKVVVDRRDNPNANTGKFVILYKQEMGPKFNSCGSDLTVVGSKIKPAYKPRSRIQK